MNLDNQGVVSGTFLRQRWVLFLVDGGIYLTESFYKWYFITMEYTTPPQKYWIYRKINAWDDQEVWTLVGNATEFWTKWAYFMIGDGYFYVGRVIIVTVFPWQFLVITQSYRYETEY